MDLLNQLKNALPDLFSEDDTEKDRKELLEALDKLNARESSIDKLKKALSTEGMQDDIDILEKIKGQVSKNRSDNPISFNKLNEYLNKAKSFNIGDVIKKNIPAVLVLGGAVALVSKGFKLIKDVVINVGKVFKGVFEGVFQGLKTGFLVIKKVWNGLYELTNKAMKAAAEYGALVREDQKVITEAAEATQETYDALTSTGAAINRLAASGIGLMNSFQTTSSRFARIFGRGSAGIANMISETSASINATGTLSEIFGEQVFKNSNSIMNLTLAVKGLGLSADDIKYFAVSSKVNLKSLEKTLSEIAYVISEVSTASDVNKKVLSKNFLILRKEIEQFGHLGDKELANVASRAIHLGIEMDQLSAIFKKVDTFESASNMASQLSQAFGMNIDALKLLKAEDPMEMIDMLRESMLATGQSFNDMSRFEKQLITQYTGLNAETTKLIFNYKDLGKSNSEIKKIMEDNKPENKQLKALNDMTTSIKEMVHVMKYTDPLQAFFDGFNENLVRSIPGIQRISNSLQGFYDLALGVDKKTMAKIGGVFGPIIKHIDESLGRFKKNLPTIIGDFSNFIGNVTKKWDNSQDNSYRKARANLGKMFEGATKGAARLRFDFVKIGLEMVGIVTKTAMVVVPTALEYLRKMLIGFREIIKGGFDSGGGNETFRGFLKSIGLTYKNFKSFYEDVKDIWKGKGGEEGLGDVIKNSFKDLGVAFYEAMEPGVKFIADKLGTYLAETIARIAPTLADKMGLGNYTMTAALGQNKQFDKDKMNELKASSSKAIEFDKKLMEMIEAEHGNIDSMTSLTDKTGAMRQFIAKSIEMQMKSAAASDMGALQKNAIFKVLTEIGQRASKGEMTDDRFDALRNSLKLFHQRSQMGYATDNINKIIELMTISDPGMTTAKEMIALRESMKLKGDESYIAASDKQLIDYTKKRVYDYDSDKAKAANKVIEETLSNVFKNMKMSGEIRIKDSGELAIHIADQQVQPKIQLTKSLDKKLDASSATNII